VSKCRLPLQLVFWLLGGNFGPPQPPANEFFTQCAAEVALAS
jgi:hypothetical protein